MYEAAEIAITPVIARRLVALIGTRIAIPVVPLPGEGLADLIYRAACINRFNSVWELLQERGRYNHTTFALKQPVISGLADRLGTPTGDADISPLRYERWRDDAQRIDFFGVSLPSSQFFPGRRVSPLALRSSLHSKAIWHLQAIDFDPQNYEFLFSRCPECGTELNFHNTIGIHRCHRCGPAFDFRDAEGSKVPIEDLDALKFVTGLVNPERPEGRCAVLRLHEDLRSENPGQIFMLCVLIASAFENQQRQSGRRIIAAAKVKAESLATAARAVLAWPDGLANIISQFGQFKGMSEKSEPHSFAVFCKQAGILSVSLMTAVKKVVTLSRLGEKQPRCLRRLEVMIGDAGKRHLSEIAGFASVTNSKPFVKAVSKAKLPPIVLYNCYLSGSCGPFSQRPEAIGEQIFVWASRLQFRHVKPGRLGRAGATPLRKFVNVFFQGRGDVWPRVLTSIQERVLPIKRNPEIGVGLDSLYVADITIWRKFLDNIDGVMDCAEFPLTSTEVAFYLNMSAGAAQTLFDFKKKITLNDLHAFKQEFVLIDHLVCMAAAQKKALSRDLIWRRLNKSGLRSTGDRVVRRAEALQFLGLDRA